MVDQPLCLQSCAQRRVPALASVTRRSPLTILLFLFLRISRDFSFARCTMLHISCREFWARSRPATGILLALEIFTMQYLNKKDNMHTLSQVSANSDEEKIITFGVAIPPRSLPKARSQIHESCSTVSVQIMSTFIR